MASAVPVFGRPLLQAIHLVMAKVRTSPFTTSDQLVHRFFTIQDYSRAGNSAKRSNGAGHWGRPRRKR